MSGFADGSMLDGYLEGGDLSSPAPNQYQHPDYIEGFNIGREKTLAEKSGPDLVRRLSADAKNGNRRPDFESSINALKDKQRAERNHKIKARVAQFAPAIIIGAIAAAAIL